MSSLVSDRILALCQDHSQSLVAELQTHPHSEPKKVQERLFRTRKRDKMRSSLPFVNRSRSRSSVSIMTNHSDLASSTSSFDRHLSNVSLPSPLDDGMLSPDKFTSVAHRTPVPSPLSPDTSTAASSPRLSHSPLSLASTPDTPASATSSVGESVSNSHARKRSTSSFSTQASSFRSYHSVFAKDPVIKEEDLDRAANCGRFTTRPSDLFLKIFVGVLRTLDNDPTANLVSPALTASTGVIPLSIISVIPDIIRHYADIILSAEREVFLATNFWENSKSSKVITDALKELSSKAGQRGTKIVVKIMYDRGNIKQLIDPHQIVLPKDYTGPAVALPHPNEVPHLDMEVMNYHKPAIGTFHGKFLVVDRKIALINSNNIQDRCNLEMCTTLEGDIVDSFMDMALATWSNSLNPPLPTLNDPPVRRHKFDFGEANAHIMAKEELKSAKALAVKNLGSFTKKGPVGRGPLRTLLWPEGGKLSAITERLNTTLQPHTKATLSATQEDMSDFQPHVVHPPHEPFPICLVNRRPNGSLNYSRIDNPQAAAWLGGFRFAQRSVFVQTPTFNAPPVVEAAIAAVRRGVKVTLFLDLGFNDAAERLPKQGGTNEAVVQQMFKELSAEEKKLLGVYWYTGKDMRRPINASQKQRNCHIKLMVVDDQVGIQGNGNQDSQSWFHSQEANIMVDSEIVVKDWIEAIYSNQNTHIYGKVDQDGVWRDPKDGSLLESTTFQGGPLGALRGLQDTIRRATGNK